VQYAVCPRCRGEGSHVNPSVDGHGITAEEMDEMGPEFFEDYMGGLYDVSCERCHGLRVVPECEADRCRHAVEKGGYYPNESDDKVPYLHCINHFSPEEESSFRDEQQYWAEVEAERRAGA